MNLERDLFDITPFQTLPLYGIRENTQQPKAPKPVFRRFTGYKRQRMIENSKIFGHLDGYYMIEDKAVKKIRKLAIVAKSKFTGVSQDSKDGIYRVIVQDPKTKIFFEITKDEEVYPPTKPFLEITPLILKKDGMSYEPFEDTISLPIMTKDITRSSVNNLFDLKISSIKKATKMIGRAKKIR